jgi:outer membrane receptor protein involved in Fe transport
VYVNIGYLTIAPKLNNVFDFNNNEFYDYKSSEVKSAEVGYGLNLKRIDVKINAYYTQWLNRPADFSRSTLDKNNETVSYQINGIDQLHKGIESEIHLQLIPQKLYLDMTAALGDYRYKSADTLYIYNDDGTLNLKKYYSAKNVHVGNAAQNQFSSAVKYNVTRDLFVKGRFTYFAKNYANFNPDDLNGDNADRDSWKMPNYSMVDLFAGYRLKGFKDLHYSFNLAVFNLFDTKYITDADNGTGYNATSAIVYMALGRRYNASILIDF